MRKQLQGIGLILLGILLCIGGNPISYLGACVGIVGLAQLFGRGESK